MGVLERPEPLPVLAGLAQVVAAPGLEVGADAEGAARARDDDDADRVVPGGVLRRARELPQHAEVEGVQHLGAVERDRGARRRLLVDDRLEAELVRVARRWVRRLAHSTFTKWTWKGTPIVHGVLAGRHELLRARRRLEGVHVGELPLGVVRVQRLTHGSAEDLPVAERPARDGPAELGVALVALGVRLRVVDDEHPDQPVPLRRGDCRGKDPRSGRQALAEAAASDSSRISRPRSRSSSSITSGTRMRMTLP